MDKRKLDIAIRRVANNFWLDYAFSASNTGGPYALERLILDQTGRESNELTNKMARFADGKTKPATKTIKEVDCVAPRASEIIGHEVWGSLRTSPALADLPWVKENFLTNDLRIAANEKLAQYVNATTINYLDRLEAVVRVAKAAAFEGDAFAFARAKRLAAHLTQSCYLPMFIKHPEHLISTIGNWFEQMEQELQKSKVRKMSALTDWKLVTVGAGLLILSFFMPDAFRQTCAVIAGVAFLLGGFDPKIRYWRPSQMQPSNE